MTRSDPLVIAGEEIGSRLIMGSAGFPNQKVMLDALEASGTGLVTASIRRISLDGYAGSLVDSLGDRYRLLPNTSGCTTVKDAVLTAQLAREALGTRWIKLELIGDRDLLYPDVEQLVAAADELVDQGFVVLPYCNEDPVICQRLIDVGCAAVMPLGAPIGSGLGIGNPAMIELICHRSEVPVIVDAGLGTASDAALAMELGCAGVMVNSAIAKSHDPVRMARAFGDAVSAGRNALLAGRIPRLRHAVPSSPELGLIET